MILDNLRCRPFSFPSHRQGVTDILDDRFATDESTNLTVNEPDCPERRDEKRQPLEPIAFELNRIVNNKQKLSMGRSRLSDISWSMRMLSQNIALRANKEDGEVRKFFQARYREVRILDETAIRACAADVDLNPIRAAIVDTIEDGDFTSGQKRFWGFGVQFLEIAGGGDGVHVGDTANNVAGSTQES